MDLIKELTTVMGEKKLNIREVSQYIGCSYRQAQRWLSGDSKPGFAYQELIKNAIERMKRL